MRSTLQIAVATALVFLVGCATSARQPEDFDAATSAALISSVRAVDLSDGVDAKEGMIFARRYFQLVYGLCGFCLSPEDRGASWYFPCAVGFDGTDEPGISVSKNGLRISCASGPEITKQDQLTNANDPIWRSLKSYRFQSSN